MTYRHVTCERYAFSQRAKLWSIAWLWFGTCVIMIVPWYFCNVANESASNRVANAFLSGMLHF